MITIKEALQQLRSISEAVSDSGEELEAKIRKVFADNKNDNSKIDIFEINHPEETKAENRWWIEHFDDHDIDFGHMTYNPDADSENCMPVFSFMVSGGCNGCGTWKNYLDDLKDVFEKLQKEVGLEPLLYKLDTDILDDLWTGMVFVYDRAPEDMKESYNRLCEELWPKKFTKDTAERFEEKEVMKAKVRDWLAAEKPCEFQIEDVPADLTWEEVIKAYKENKEPRGGLHLDTEPREYIWQRAGELYYLQTGEFLDSDFERIYKEKRTDLQTPEEKVEGEEMLMATKPGVPEDGEEVAIEEPAEEPIEEKVEKHDTLNPKLFDGNKLRPEIKDAAKKIADKYMDTLKEYEVPFNLKDIVLVGSNTSYNYNDKSDLDLHLLADMSGIKDPKSQATIYGAYASLFNKNYSITFYDIPVEIYVETEDNPVKINGIYSVLQDRWIREPVQQEIPDLDEEAFNKMLEEWKAKCEQVLGITSSTEENKEDLIEN